jgi:hypothetical protein
VGPVRFVQLIGITGFLIALVVATIGRPDHRHQRPAAE